jgi:anti-anti-sigma factor
MIRVETHGAVNVITPNVPINHEHAAELVQTLTADRTAGKPMLVLNMSEVTLLDSAGLEALLDSQEAVQDRGGTVKLAALSPLCREILRIAAVDRHFEAYRDVKSAVGSFVQ